MIKLDKKKKLALGALAGVALFGLGAATGSGGSKAEAEPHPVPTVTATATVTSPPKIETRTVEKVVEKTPAECLTALDLAGQGFALSSESMTYMKDGMTAASEFDVAGIRAATAKLQSVNPKYDKLQGPLAAAVSACRAKG